MMLPISARLKRTCYNNKLFIIINVEDTDTSDNLNYFHLKCIDSLDKGCTQKSPLLLKINNKILCYRLHLM